MQQKESGTLVKSQLHFSLKVRAMVLANTAASVEASASGVAPGYHKIVLRGGTANWKQPAMVNMQ